MIKEYEGLTLITDPLLDKYSVKHIFTTASDKDGVADFSFNTSDKDKVLGCYERIASFFGVPLSSIVKSTQIHKDKIEEITAAHKGMGIVRETAFESADGIFTLKKDIPLCIFSADCVPILIADKNKKAVFGVHSGWKGTALDIAGKAIRLLKEKTGCESSDIICAIGPSISLCCFEVSYDVIEALGKIYDVSDCCYKKDNGKYMLDLKKFNKLLLMKEGVPEENISVSDYCTRCCDRLFHSYRRDGDKSGRNAAFIML